MKKIIGILLAFTLIFSSAFITSAEDAPLAKSSDLAFMKNLGIISEKNSGSDIISRMELADTYMNIVMEGMRSEYMDIPIPFNDVPENGYAAGFVSSMGIMNGVGGGLFMPDAPVTYHQMIKTIVTFLGYHNQANAMGGYPYGYFTQAARLGIIIPGVSGEVEVTAGILATTLKLCLNVHVMSISQYGDEERWESTGMDYLALYKKVYRSRGVITANHATDLYSDKTIGYYDIRLNDIFLMLGDGARGLLDYLGYRVDVYYTYNNEGVPYAKAYEICENYVYEIDGDDIQNLAKSSISYYDGLETLEAGLSKSVSVIYNGTYVASYDNSVINPYKDSYVDGGLTLIDNNRDGVCDVVLVDAFDTYVVSEVRDGYIYNKYRPTQYFDTKRMDNENTYITNIFGEPIKLEEITKGSIISVSRDILGNVKRIVVTVDSYSETLEEISYDGTRVSSMLIGGIEYKCSKTLSLNPDIDKIKVGEGVTCFFNKNGEISDIDLSSFDKYLYGYLVDAAYEGNGIEKSYNVKIFTDGGEMAVFPLSEKVMYNKESEIPDANVFSLFGTVSETGRVIRQGIKYELNKNGEISGICLTDTGVDAGAAGEKNDVFFRFPGFDGVTDPPTAYRGSVNGFSGLVLFSNKTRTFLVPSEEDRDEDDKYKIVAITTIYYDNYQRTPFAAYGSNSKSAVADMIVVDSSKFGGGSTSVTSQIVTFVRSISETVNEKNEKKFKLYGILNGSDTSILIDPKNMIEDIEMGDIITLVKNSDGEAEALQKVFDKGSMKLAEGIPNPSIDAYSGNGRMAFGKAIYGDDYHFTIEITKDDGTKIQNSYPYGKFSAAVYACDGKQPTLEKGSDTALLKNEHLHPGQASYVFIYTMGGDAKYMLIYNN